MDLRRDHRIVLTLDAGGTTSVFSAIQSTEEIVEPITMASESHDLTRCLAVISEGFESLYRRIPKAPAAISFAFPGPSDYVNGVIGPLANMPAFNRPFPLAAMLEERFRVPVFIHNDGDLFTYGEAMAGFLPEVNRALKAAGNPKRFKNLLGITLGTGFGAGLAIDGRMFLGDNGSGASIWCTRNKFFPACTAEESVSIRAVRRVYAEVADLPLEAAPEPKLIHAIALEQAEGHRAAAQEAFRCLGEAAGEALANANSMVDALIVVGGGLSGAGEFILPAMVAAMNTPLKNLRGKELCHGEVKVYSYEDPEERETFLACGVQQLAVSGSSRTVAYDLSKRTAIGLTRLGTSRATSIGAYAYALSELDQRGNQ